MGLAERAESSSRRDTQDGRSRDSGRYPLQGRNLQANNIDIGDLGDIFKNGDFGDILGGVLGGKGAGRIGRIRLRATNFTFQGARYDALDATLGEVRFDWAKALRGDFDVKSVQPGTLGLSVRADQAARLLAPRLPSVRDVRVRFSNGLAYVGGRTEYMGVGVPFEVGGRLSVQQNEVRADNLQASVARLRLPSFVVNELTRGVNPLFDFDPQNRWPLAINLNTAGTTNNAMALRGGIQWLGFNRSGRNDTRRRDDGYDDGYRNDDYRNDRNRDDDPGYDYDPDYDDSSTRYPDQDRNTSTKRQPQDILGDIFGR
jgi:hypothetical protein